jgi:hypothetical protein
MRTERYPERPHRPKKNARIPESTLTKKQNAINDHAVSEAAGILRVEKEDGETYLADLLTNVLICGQKRCYLLLAYNNVVPLFATMLT